MAAARSRSAMAKPFLLPTAGCHCQALAGGASPRDYVPNSAAMPRPPSRPMANGSSIVHSYEHVDGLAIVDAAGEEFPAQARIWHRLSSCSRLGIQGGNHIAFIAWNHPQMPWNGSELRLVSLAIWRTAECPMPLGYHYRSRGHQHIRCFQPEFSPDGRYLVLYQRRQRLGPDHTFMI